MSDYYSPDFVWQHQYNKRWITYSDNCNRILNEAYKKWQKSISLPYDDSSKNIVYLDKMYQINEVSRKTQKVRCVLYNNAYVTWLWMDDDNSWSGYRPHLSFLLEIAYERKEKKFKFFLNSDYCIDLESYQQVNEATTFSRAITREEVHIENLGAIILAKFRGFKKMCKDPRINFQNRCINLPSLSSTMQSMCNIPQRINIPPSTLDDCIENIQYEANLPVDSECDEKAGYHLYMEDCLPFSAMLILVDMKANINKFYLIQLLESNQGKNFAIWQRYGRTGCIGQNEFTKLRSNIAKAKSDFEAKFYEKTKNLWSNIKYFQRIDGKYDLLKMDLNPLVEVQTAEVDLDPSIYKIMHFMCNEETLSASLNDMSYDSVNAPLGSLASSQIKDGYNKLSQIAEVASSAGAGSELIAACEEFYMKIPHNFGKKNPLVLQTKEDIEQKLEMLEALANAKIAFEMFKTSSEIPEHPLNRCYNSFCCSLELLDSTSDKYSAIENCMKSTHGSTHCNYETEIIDIYKCIEKEPSLLALGNTHFLWHGSRSINFVSILKKGLRIAPREAPSTGALFGKGLYFADVASKSENYCHATTKNNEGLLLLCEVALGKVLELTTSKSSLSHPLPSNCNSVKGIGRIVPSNFTTGILSPEAKVPVGPLVERQPQSYSLQYNEYVVYDVSQVKLKYLLRIKFNFK